MDILLKNYQKNFSKTIAIDNSESGIEQAKKDYSGSINFTLSDLSNLDFKDKVNCITLIEVIEHLYSPDSLLKKINKFCNNNTKVIISTPFHGFIKNLLIMFSGKFDDHFSPLWEHGHIKFFTKKHL